MALQAIPLDSLRCWVQNSSHGRQLSKGALAVIVTSFIARRIYHNVKKRRNKKKMQKKREELAARKKNLEERLDNGKLNITLNLMLIQIVCKWLTHDIRKRSNCLNRYQNTSG